MTNGFGIIAFISVTPLIAVQALGMIYDMRLAREHKRMEEAEFAEIEELAFLADHAGKILIDGDENDGTETEEQSVLMEANDSVD